MSYREIERQRRKKTSVLSFIFFLAFSNQRRKMELVRRQQDSGDVQRARAQKKGGLCDATESEENQESCRRR